jgi:hypothetical protein
MKRISACMLLVVLSVAVAPPTLGRSTDVDYSRQSPAAKQQAKMLKKMAKRQRKAMKRSLKQQRKAQKANRQMS